MSDPTPLRPGDLDDALSALDDGAPFKATLERLLLTLPTERAEHLMLCMREGRGAYRPLLRTHVGRAVFIGNSLSGTAAALGRCGFELTVVDPHLQRLRFAEHRDRLWCFGRSKFVCSDYQQLPFPDKAFDLVVCEPAVQPFGEGETAPPSELLRIGCGEWVRHAENRLAYKRSTGTRGDFAKARVGDFLRRVRKDREQPLGAGGFLGRLRRESNAFSPGLDWNAQALYPHQNDFSHVVDCDGAGLALTVGPKEKQNRAKWFAQRAGMFPWLAPSLLALGRTSALERSNTSSQLDGLLEHVAAELGVPCPRAEVLVATRGNTAVVHTRPGSAAKISGATSSESDGRWTLHLPLSAHQTRQAQQHFARLDHLRVHHPLCPVPEPLWEGIWAGAYACVERRLGGWTAPHLSGDQQAAERTYSTVAAALAGLAATPARPLDSARMETLFTQKVRLVQRFCAHPPLARELDERLERACDLAAGEPVPDVVYHSDLRAKHVQVTPEGDLLGLLDWGSSQDADLPYFDLLNLIVHDRKQQAGRSLGWAWGLAQAGELRAHEQQALDEYAERLSLTRRYREAIETLYPALVGAMAESNWDYSRPRWLARTLDRL